MSKIKYILILLIFYGLYKGYVAFTEFEIGVSDRVAKLEEAAEIEKKGEVIALNDIEDSIELENIMIAFKFSPSEN